MKIFILFEFYAIGNQLSINQIYNEWEACSIIKLRITTLFQ